MQGYVCSKRIPSGIFMSSFLICVIYSLYKRHLVFLIINSQIINIYCLKISFLEMFLSILEGTVCNLLTSICAVIILQT